MLRDSRRDRDLPRGILRPKNCRKGRGCFTRNDNGEKHESGRLRRVPTLLQIERNATQEALKQQERSAKAQAMSSSRVQERLKARNALKHSNLLRSTKMFSGLDTENTHIVVDAMEFRLVAAGQNICTQGDEGNSMMVIISGKAELRKEFGEGDDAATKVLGKLGATATIGEQCLLPGNHTRTAAVVASEYACTDPHEVQVYGIGGGGCPEPEGDYAESENKREEDGSRRCEKVGEFAEWGAERGGCSRGDLKVNRMRCHSLCDI